MSLSEEGALLGLPLLAPTPEGWAEAAIQDLDALLADHAHCEMKAAATGFRLLGSYPELGDLVDAMLVLVREEMRHFERVRRVLEDRGGVLRKALPDRYVRRLHSSVGSKGLVTKLILCAFVEARSCERFRLLAALGSSLPRDLASFYGELAVAEARHHEIFFELARRYSDGPIDARIAEIGAAEAGIIGDLPPAAAIH